MQDKKMLSVRNIAPFSDDIFIEDVSVREIAERYGTPTYIYSKKSLNDSYDALLRSMKLFNNYKIFYAIKANNNPYVAKEFVSRGAGIDAASPFEIMLAMQLGLFGGDISFTGSSLSVDDIQFAIDLGVHFNVDDVGILDKIFSYGRPNSMSFRVNVGSEDEAGMLNFSGDQSKFGILPRYASEGVRRTIEAGVERISLHMMPGSCRLDTEYFVENARKLARLAVNIAREFSISFDYLNLGGGIGIPYSDDEKEIDLEELITGVKRTLEEEFEGGGMDVPAVAMEPARFLVGPAGYLLGKVHAVKNSSSVIVGTDISMNTMVRTVLYGIEHRMLINGKMNDDTLNAGMCGQVCENTDFFIRKKKFPSTVEAGDLIVMRDVGAYGYSMAYDYNGRATPAEVLVDGATHSLIRRRKSFSDLLGLVEGSDWCDSERGESIEAVASRHGFGG